MEVFVVFVFFKPAFETKKQTNKQTNKQTKQTNKTFTILRSKKTKTKTALPPDPKPSGEMIIYEEKTSPTSETKKENFIHLRSKKQTNKQTNFSAFGGEKKLPTPTSMPP